MTHVFLNKSAYKFFKTPFDALCLLVFFILSNSNVFASGNRLLNFVEKQIPEIVFPAIRASLNTPSFIPTIESNSSGAYTFSSSDETIARVSGGKIKIVGAGTAIITVVQASTANYFSSTVTTTLSVYNDHAYINELLGQDIDGEASSDYSGWSVSLSSDGKTVATGAYNNDGNGANSGHVRVYKWNGSAWAQLGLDIDGEASSDYSGWSVSLSSDGKTVAIGASNNDGNGTDSGHVRVYEWNGSAWARLGLDIDGEAAGDESGSSVSLSSDGKTVAIGASNNDGNGTSSGQVRLYKWNGSAWTKLGLDIDGEAAGDESGSSVSLSSDSKTVAIGAFKNEGNGTDSGHVRVYEWNGSAWTKLGQDLDGESAGDRSGSSVSLSSDGKTVAIGAIYNDGNGRSSGQVRVYEWNGSAWTKLGQDIDGEASFDLSGSSVSLSSDGKIVAIGAIYNDGNGASSGHVRVYEWNGSAWIKLGLDIDGEEGNNNSGFSVSLSSDGKTVAVGAPINHGNGFFSGHLRVYSLVNYAPITSSITRTVTKQETATINLTATDVDSAQASITFSIVNGPLNGTATISGKSVLYTNTSDTATSDVFTYKANDGNTDSNLSTVFISIKAKDTDGDGIGDVIDTDDDNDGCPDTSDDFPLDASECSDTDGDGTGDNADTDNDNDGVLDTLDNCPNTPNADQLDTDADGIGNICDSDDDNDGFSDADEATCGTNPLDATSTPTDTDADGTPDCIDTDDDNDGFSDEVETTCATDPLDATSTPKDTDSDGAPDCIDTDDDNDGFEDENDAFPLDATEWLDTDADGIGNNADQDDDNDGQTDVHELACGSDPLDSNETSADADADGLPNCVDEDDDNDGVNDSSDAFPLDHSEWTDTDGDGIGNNADEDDDNDGYSDFDELACASDPLDRFKNPADQDQDGLADCIDSDRDGDGVENTQDVFPDDASEWLDTDGDGLGDNFEVDDDNDGVLDSQDAFPLDPAEWADADGDGIGDNADPDDNNDGFEDETLFPSGVLTPNSNGLESTWKIINIEKYPNARVRVYNKNGQEVFSKVNYTNDWRGTFKNSTNPLPAGFYYYMIDLANGEDPLKGWLYLTY